MTSEATWVILVDNARFWSERRDEPNRLRGRGGSFITCKHPTHCSCSKRVAFGCVEQGCEYQNENYSQDVLQYLQNNLRACCRVDGSFYTGQLSLNVSLQSVSPFAHGCLKEDTF